MALATIATALLPPWIAFPASARSSLRLADVPKIMRRGRSIDRRARSRFREHPGGVGAHRDPRRDPRHARRGSLALATFFSSRSQRRPEKSRRARGLPTEPPRPRDREFQISTRGPGATEPTTDPGSPDGEPNCRLLSIS